jgi:hypothetical protein
MRTKTALVGLILFSFFLAPWITASEKHALNSVKFQAVNKIYVGEMGTTDEAARFRMLLADELSHEGFTVVEHPNEADGVLTGVLVVRVHAERSATSATLELRSSTGEKIWESDFKPTSKNLRKDSVRACAKKVAQTLQKDRQEAAKPSNKVK